MEKYDNDKCETELKLDGICIDLKKEHSHFILIL